MPRSSHALAILGADLHSKLPTTRILIVGAGGIGCELLKNVVLTGFGDITLLDLDTIDLSNLNRQFLFRKKDVKQSKALVAARTAGPFNPACKITPIHANIKDPQYDVEWFSGFQIVLNALDNLDARRHVNRMCMAANIPLIESGTAGYLGQVQPILKDKTECFDCLPKPTPKTFPVCTIRSTPSAPIHCIVWAKSYLFPQLFGEDQEDGEAELDAAAAQGENALEIAKLREEAALFQKVRVAMLKLRNGKGSNLVFDKIFNRDINRLLSMADMWKNRRPPTPLNRDAILAGTFRPSNGHATGGESSNGSKAKRTSNGATKAKNGKTTKAMEQESHGLKDQRDLTLADSVRMFDDSCNRLSERLRSGEKSLSFDKDDDDSLDFVTATANLRAYCYGIPTKTRWEVKEMAGNIIPAIATTNAVISGLIVLQALHVLRGQFSSTPSTSKTTDPTLRNVFLQSGKPSVPLGSYVVSPPNEYCGVCRETYITVQCDFDHVTLGSLVDAVVDAENLGDRDRMEVTVYEEGRILYDPDLDDNLEKTLAELNCTRGKFLTIADEEGKYGNLVVCLVSLAPNVQPPAQGFILPSHIPVRPLRPTPPPEPSPPSSPAEPIYSPVKKRPAPDDDDLEEQPASKRAKIGNGDLLETPKKRRENELLEEDGVIIVEDDDDDVEIL